MSGSTNRMNRLGKAAGGCRLAWALVLLAGMWGSGNPAAAQREAQQGRELFFEEILYGGYLYAPNGRQVLFGDRNGLWLTTTGGTPDQEPRYLAPGDGYAWLAWSPDSRWIACAGSQIWKIAVDSGERVVLTRFPEGGYGGTRLSWTPDGAYILFEYDGQVYGVPSQGGEPVKYRDIDYSLLAVAGGFVLSPDGRFFVFEGEMLNDSEGRQGLWLLKNESEQNEPVRLTDGPCDIMPVWSPDGQWIAFTRLSAAQYRGAGSIWAYRLRDGYLVQLTLAEETPETDLFVSWSATAQKISFLRFAAPFEVLFEGGIQSGQVWTVAVPR